MTQEIFQPTPLVTIDGPGPYTIMHGYDVGALVVAAIDGGTRTILNAQQFSVSPERTNLGGELTLTAGAAAIFAGQLLEITRDTDVEQGFEGQTSREKGLEAQLDWLTRSIQDLRRGLQNSLRTSVTPLRLLPINRALRVLGFDAEAQPIAGPTFDQIENAQMFAIQAGQSRDAAAVSAGQSAMSATASAGSAAAALTSRNQAQGFRNESQTFRNEAQGFRNESQTFRDAAQTFRNEAQAARDLARRWATEDEDVPVEGGAFSALHWAIKAQQAATVDATVFVAVDGDDDADGRAIARPVATIERAIQIAVALNLPKGLIHVGPGEYVTAGSLALPPGWVIQCVHRTVTLVPSPGNESANVFLLSGGNFVEGFTGVGWQIDDLDNPGGGFLAAFNPGAFIDRLPYVHKCVMFRPQPKALIGPPMDRANGNPAVGNGGGVILADGAVPHPLSPFKQIMAWGATPSSPNGIGYCAKNLGFINAVNAVALWSHKHFLALSGGQILLSSCSTQFGDWTLFADGHGQSLRPVDTTGPLTVQTGAANAVDAARAAIIDSMWSALVAGGFTTGWTAADETFTRRDAGFFLDAVVSCLRGGNQRPLQDFARGLFKAQATADYWVSELVAVFASAKLAAFQFSFIHMRNSIKALPAVGAAADSMMDGLVAALNATIDAPTFRRERSLITAIGHQWTQPLAGVTRSALPARFGGSGKAAQIGRSVRQRRGGRVISSGQDDEGNAVFVGGLRIDARTGQLGGRPFDSAVEIKAIEAAIAGGL